MDKQGFKTLAAIARDLTGTYGEGYRRGFRRLYRAEGFGGSVANAGSMHLLQDDDSRADFARGFLDGLAGRTPALEAT